MLTSRGRFFLLAILTLLGLASLMPPHGHGALAIMALALLLWFLFEWAMFAIRVQSVVPQLVVERELRDERGVVENLWTGRVFEVRVRLRLGPGLRLPYVVAGERVPFGLEHRSGDLEWEGELRAEQPAELTYRIACPAPGRVRFEGLSAQLADLQGFFYHRTFVRRVRTYRVLPVLADTQGHFPATKRHNLLPPPGIHRLRRPGSGSELLDLRDYLPGDPPKTIAWKVSARRDRLITKEFESEVPVRRTLFVDASNSVRLGPSTSNALAKLVEIAGTVAQASIGNRDPIGMAIFDEQQSNYLRPARGARHLTLVLNLLADASGQPATTGEAPVEALAPLAYSLAHEVYPDQLRSDINAFPAWLPWLKPRSVFTIARPTLADHLNHWLPFALVFYMFCSALTVVAAVVGLTLLLHFFGFHRMATVWLDGLAAFLLTFLLIGLPSLFFPERRRLYRWRKQLSALLSVRYGLGPGGLALLLENDRDFSLAMQRFLSEHQVPLPLPLYDGQGRYLFAAPQKVEVLAGSLLRAVGKGHDNEMFILLADLLELTDELGPLLRAVKVALARHHQVLVVCPWPPGLPPPDSRHTAPTTPPPHAHLDQVIEQATTQRFHEAFAQLRRTFARLGVPVLCAQDPEPARLIVERLDRLRTLRSSPHPAARK